MACHCDFREDCCCQDDVRMTYETKRKVMIMLGVVIAVGVACALVWHFKK